MLIKIANSDLVLSTQNELSAEQALSSPQITERFKRLASEIRKVAPRSNEFLYFVARGIHSMEHAAIDPVSKKYSPKLGHIAHDNGKGQCATCNHVLVKSHGNPIDGLWCEASEVEPWINQNGDAFPEYELLKEVTDPKDSLKTIKAFQTFIGKGLFTDHKSSEVENIRGIILDAEYDHSSKGVDLLIALDKVNYPELARQVSAGYSTQVSMGTQVNYSLCSLCGNKAVTEHDYCNHVKAGKGLSRAGEKRCYEVNNGLNFIEISMVGNAADPRAMIKTIIAQAQNAKKDLENLKATASQPENQLILNSIGRLESQIVDLQTHLAKMAGESRAQEQSLTSELLNKIANLENQINEIGGRFMSQKTQEKKAYMQGTVEPDLKNSFDMADKGYMQYWEDDKHLSGEGLDGNGTEGLHAGYGLGSDEDVKKMYQRAKLGDRKAIRQALLQRVSYMQGTVEPDLKNSFEMADKNYTKYWEDDKHLHGEGMESGSEGMHPGYGLGSDEQVKKELLRAKLRARLEKHANPSKNRWTVFAGEQQLLSVTAEEAYSTELEATATEIDDSTTNQEWFDSKNYGLNLIQAVKSLGLEKVAKAIKKAKTVKAQAAGMPVAPAPAPLPEADLGAAPEAAPTDEAVTPTTEVAEGIRAAAERIESAKDEINSLVDTLSGDEAEQGEQLASDLGQAGEELGDLGADMAAPMPPAVANAYKRLVRTALVAADALLTEAEAFVEEVTTEDSLEVLAKKKMNPGFQKYLDSKKGKGKKDDKKKDKKDDKKKEKKEALSDEELTFRRYARYAVANELYNITDGDMIAEAHPKGGNTTTFPGQEEGKVETVTEAQEKDMEAANSLPRGELVARRNYRNKLIATAQKLIFAEDAPKKTPEQEEADKAAAIKAEADARAAAEKAKAPVAAATRKAEVDKETKQYYKEEGSQSATGQKPDPAVSQFYTQLTQDFAGKKSTAATHDHGLKMKRAFSVAMRRASLGQIESTQEAIEVDVDRLMNLDDSSFLAFAEVVENTKKAKVVTTASAPKQVRTAGALSVGINESQPSFTDQLDKLPWK